MPTRAPRPCRVSGCPGLDRDGDGYCEPLHAGLARQKAAAYEASRGTATQRGYGSDWRALRAQVTRTPCPCGAAWRPNFHLDHIVARRAGGGDDPGNLRWLCERCHGAKTGRQDGGFGNPPQARQDAHGRAYRAGR